MFQKGDRCEIDLGTGLAPNWLPATVVDTNPKVSLFRRLFRRHWCVVEVDQTAGAYQGMRFEVWNEHFYGRLRPASQQKI